MTDKETYLGDGLYASFDGYYIWVRTGGGGRIALDPDVFSALVKYNNTLYARISGESND